MPLEVSWIALILAIFTSTGLLLSRDWRWRLGFLATLYLSIFLLIQVHWPISMAAAKLVTGWMACAVLGIALRNSGTDESEHAHWLQGRLFQFFAAGMVLVVTYSFSERVTTLLGISLPVAWASLLLMGLGLLQLGISSNPFHIITGLLSILAGFEIIYAGVENSILVTALIALVDLGLALAGAFFLTAGPEVEV